jgi:hypothetical protein
LGITKPLAKFDAVALFNAFLHCAQSKNATSTCYTSTHTGCRTATDSIYKVIKNHACALGTTAAASWVLSLASNYFPRKKKVGYFVETSYTKTRCIFWDTRPCSPLTEVSEELVAYVFRSEE